MTGRDCCRSLARTENLPRETHGAYYLISDRAQQVCIDVCAYVLGRLHVRVTSCWAVNTILALFYRYILLWKSKTVEHLFRDLYCYKVCPCEKYEISWKSNNCCIKTSSITMNIYFKDPSRWTTHGWMAVYAIISCNHENAFLSRCKHKKVWRYAKISILGPNFCGCGFRRYLRNVNVVEGGTIQLSHVEHTSQKCIF